MTFEKTIPLGQLLRRPPRYGINAAAVPFSPDTPTYLRITDINNSGRFSPNPKVGVAHSNASDYRLKPGELVFARTGASVGKSYLYNPQDGELVYAGFLINVSPDPAMLCPHFLSFFVQTKNYWDWISRTSVRSGQPGVNGREFASLPVPMVDISIQTSIASTLIDVDKLIGSLDRLIAKKQAIKLGMMQQLLTGQTRLPGFSGDWIKKLLKDIVQTPITDGPHLTPKFLPIGVPFLSVNNLVDGKIDWDDVRYISRSDHAEFSKKCAPRRGDILLGKAASVGKVALVEADIQFNIWSPIAMIRISREHDSRFLHYQLQSAAVENQIALLTNTSSQGNIGMGDIGKLVIGLPPRDEQRAIARCLRDADIEIDAMKKKLNQTHSIKKGMMQELLTGRTRLHVTESAA